MLEECIATGTEAADDGVWHDEQEVETTVGHVEEYMFTEGWCGTKST